LIHDKYKNTEWRETTQSMNAECNSF